MNKAIIYCRLSQAKGTRKGSNSEQTPMTELSCQSQEQICREFCRERNIEIVSVVHEICSGRNMEKMKQFQSIIEDVPAGYSILISDITRLSRNTLQALKILNSLKSKNVDVYSVIDKIGYRSSQDKNIFRILLSKAEHESDQISDRIKRSVEYRKSRGIKVGKPKFGFECYRDANGTRRERINAHEQEILHKISNLLANGSKTRDVAANLNKSGITFRSEPWTATRVKYVAKLHHLESKKIKKMVKPARVNPYQKNNESGYDSDTRSVDSDRVLDSTYNLRNKVPALSDKLDNFHL